MSGPTSIDTFVVRDLCWRVSHDDWPEMGAQPSTARKQARQLAEAIFAKAATLAVRAWVATRSGVER